MTRRNWAFDVALALVVGVLGQLEAWTALGATHRQGPLWVQSLLYAVTAALLVGRRWRPLAVLAAMVLVSVLEFAAVGSPEGNAVALAPVIVTYTAAHELPWRRSWAALALALVVVAAWAVLDPMSSSGPERMIAMVWFTPTLIAWLLGALVRATRLNVEQRRVNAAQRATQAVAEERTRIARELHDAVGHSVSVMTVQASAVRRRLEPSQVVEREALESVEAVGRQALVEMRRMVSVLREEGESAGLQPPPGLSQVERLAAQVRAAGLPVRVLVTGDPAGLPPGLDLTAYRVVQEGLTNALRHATNAHEAEVSIDRRQDRLELAVRDDGEAPPTRLSDVSSGTGLHGLRERVAVYGGSLEARARAGRGFELVASLPVEQA
ncbi:sensor histidine kinase [Ornithinimicrobium sp. LYQ121]|uniref:sensor histidine kinase n=1 Tax=Ornithinimicrobium sp. LYQ121 TaxID=3378801 RepID=UPI003851CBAC